MSEIAREVRDITSRGEWLAWREKDLTASRIAALFDQHPYMTLDGLAASLRGVSHGDSPAMRRGRILEPAVAAAIAEEKPDWRIVKATTYHRLPDLRLGCTPDYWLDDDGLIQVGTMSLQAWEQGGGRAPFYKTLQTLVELMVTGRTRGVLAIMVCSPSYPVHLFDVPRHEGAEQRIADAVAVWWRRWDHGFDPQAMSGDGLAEALDDGSHRDLSADNQLPELLDERETLKASVSGNEKRLKEIDYEIKNRIGAARTAWLPGWTLKYPSIHAKEYTVAAKDYRRLTISRTEE